MNVDKAPALQPRQDAVQQRAMVDGDFSASGAVMVMRRGQGRREETQAAWLCVCMCVVCSGGK